MTSRAGSWVLGALLLAWAAPARAYVWWEAEAPAATSFPGRSAFSPVGREADVLSAGAWLSASGPRGKDALYARYRVAAPAAGVYQLWARKFWKHGPFRWRFDGEEWRECGSDVALADSVDLRTHVCANWVHLGAVRLSAGEHAFEVRLLAGEGEQATAAFDCFLLTDTPFLPRGKLKPDQKSGLTEPGWFAYEPELDPFRDDALLDLRPLNEKAAGQSGPVRAAGEGFVLGDGRPVRFWAVNVGPGNIGQDRASIDYLARRLAKLGVNMVRFHGPIFDARAADPAAVDRQRLDDLQYLVAALKRQGIYTKLSFYFPLWFDVKATYGIGGFDKQQNKKPFALLYFDPRMQAIHRAWLRALLTTPSPHAGQPLGQDPAVAIVEIINEDSFFFWTFSKQNIPAEHWSRLEARYAEWLTRKYGSTAQALAAWGPRSGPEGAGLLEAWHMTAAGLKQGGEAKRRRMSDQVRFLAETQRQFYADTVRHMKQDLGYQGLVSCSNWHVTDARLLDAVERWTYTAGDVIDRHGYFGGKHEGDGAGYSVRVGHSFQDRAGVLDPAGLPIQCLQVAGYPQIVSEVGWTNPNRFRAEATFLAAAYGALQDVDGFFWFAVGSNYLLDQSMNKFAVSSPAICGAFPAAALMYRRGDVRPGDLPGVFEHLTLERLFALEGEGVAAAAALDPLRAGEAADGAGGDAGRSPLAFYVSRVRRILGGPAPASPPLPAAQFADAAARTVRSQTGELVWDYGRGIVTCASPRTVGVAGFLKKAGAVTLGGIGLASENEFGAILVTSLDDQPLAASRRMLVQAMTEEKPYGFASQGGKITAMGTAPFQIRRIDATVTIPGAAAVIPLDLNGYRAATGAAATAAAGPGTGPVKLPADVIYTLIERR